MNGRSAQAAGFTLLELMAALVVLGFLMVGLSAGLRFGVQAYDRQSRMVDAGSELDATARALRRLIEQMTPDSPGMARIEGSARALRFGTELPDAAAALPTRSIDAELRVDGARRLVLVWSPAQHVQPLAAAPPPTDTVLLSGVERLDLSYRLPPSRGSGWVDTWASTEPPQAIRVRIVFPPGDVRRWPDLVATPMRDRVQL
ncbi:MAG: prepilin-type N-terminal cleavage/methylation domain-containing protein [Acetobacteraceae bacterium]|nr:prepilin-type N-terminal cleavage/methylation domain-containing protein [Acetobacteraceae bacterium]